MKLRTRLRELEKQFPQENNFSHLTDGAIRERLWAIHRISRARRGEEVTDAEEQLFRSDPESALLHAGQWKLDHWTGSDLDAKEKYRRLIESRAARLQARGSAEPIRQMILQRPDGK